MKRCFIFFITIVGSLLWPSGFRSSEACTLWGATGGWVEGGGTLIVKNRDRAPDHRQELAVLKPAEGYRSLALMAVGGAEPGIKAGVNEKGLVIISASANQVPSAERKKFQQKKGLIGHLLATSAGVGDVLRNLDLMKRPVFYLVGDSREIALIEVAPDGRRGVTRKESGSLAHTNHYFVVDTPLLRKAGESSTRRLARIEALLQIRGKPFQPEDFIRFSEDRSAGPDNSIWRTGSPSARNRTLATWLVFLSSSGSPQLYLKTADPGRPERICRLSVEAVLGSDTRKTIALDNDLCKGAASQ